MRHFRTPAFAAALLLAGAPMVGAQHQHGYQCGPPPPLTAGTVPLWDGVAGTVHFPISVHGAQWDSVRAYFDQGLALMYGYNFGEAVLSFHKAAVFDPHCAMCFWGVASALGANINEGINAQRWKIRRAAAVLLSRAALPGRRAAAARPPNRPARGRAGVPHRPGAHGGSA